MNLATVQKQKKIIVILPLGLPDQLPSKIRHHSVEDYVLKQLLKRSNYKRDIRSPKSKEVYQEILNSHGLSERALISDLFQSIIENATDIKNHLRPLWDKETWAGKLR
jgi:hypothetical protein